VRRAVRLAVPGPVWGERPRRAEPAHDGGSAVPPAPRRGPPAARAGALARLLTGRGGHGGVARVATSAGRLAQRLARGVATGGAPARGAPGPPTEPATAPPKAPPALPACEPPRALARAAAAAAARLSAEGLTPTALAAALGAAGAMLAHATGLEPRDNQYRCAAHLLGERLVELDTGEGKSVAVALAAGVAALAGAPVHVLTANGYLAGRDARFFTGYFRGLGLSVAAVDEAGDDDARRAAWRADVAYAPARLLGFDELRDALAVPAGGPPLLSRGLCVAIVDEADAVLLDEARTPLVIAQARPDPALRARAWRALDLARRLAPGAEVEIDEAAGTARMTAAGRAALALKVHAEGPGDGLDARQRADLVDQALVALHALRRDVHYVVVDREIVLIDASTGRPSPGRAWSRALHALVALKEGLPVPPANDVRASITYPRLLARYHHLCGTSGTLRDAARELRRAYGLRVVRVEPARPSRRARAPTRLFPDRDAQFEAAVGRAAELAAAGRCVLVATDTVAESAALAMRFEARGVAVTRLDARHDRDEHLSVSRAGEAGRITVATQMAGRGTDIRPTPEALAAGGLHVLSLQHNRNARLDRQLAGRAARQGDPGSVEHWLRRTDCAFEPDRLPRPLRPLVRTAGALTASQGSGRRGWIVAGVWRICQRWWRIEDRVIRSEALDQDRRWSRRLHFATIRES
jgi:preprotein translocase subunit SecA